MSERKTKKKTPRNAPCPCGSGKKFKHCCGHPRKRISNQAQLEFPIEIPTSKKIFYLDTCVWSQIGKSTSAKSGLVKFCNDYQPALAISQFILFELSRAPQILESSDTVMYDLRDHIYLASFYDQVIESELDSFPQSWQMKWLPLFIIKDFNSADFVKTLVKDPLFIESREEFRQFGLSEFKSLVDLKANFPPLHDDHYTLEDAQHFSFATTMEYLGRHFPRFLKKTRDHIRDEGYTSLDSIWSLRIRGLFLFIKYYLHNQIPNDSDFFDFAQMSYAPYCNGFVTEKNAYNVLRRIKSNDLMLQDTDIIFVSDFVRMMEQKVFQPLLQRQGD